MSSIDRIGNNETVLKVGVWSILYSYNTPVAAYDGMTGRQYKTSRFHSKTTSKHINGFLGGGAVTEKEPDWFNNLAQRAGVMNSEVLRLVQAAEAVLELATHQERNEELNNALFNLQKAVVPFQEIGSPIP